MNGAWGIVAVSVGLIAASAFFVAVEFSLIAARRHRLEDAAGSSRSARAALRSTTELSVMLAGSQLGITVCTLALGAVTKPAVKDWLTPAMSSWGAPQVVADVGSFVLALFVVTFVHLVVGEMAPKSWAIAHPERSATMLALPMRGFMAVTRPLIALLNQAANWCLRRVGVVPVDEVAAGQNPEGLRQLVEHSASAGTLDEQRSRSLVSALELQALTVADVAPAGAAPDSVPTSAGAATIAAASRATGHLRLLVRGDGTGDGGAVSDYVGMVHVRDSLRAADGATAATLMRPLLWLRPETPVSDALATMRRTRNHLAVVADDDGVTGLVTITDVLQRLLDREHLT